MRNGLKGKGAPEEKGATNRPQPLLEPHATEQHGSILQAKKELADRLKPLRSKGVVDIRIGVDRGEIEYIKISIDRDTQQLRRKIPSTFNGFEVSIVLSQ